MTPITLPRATVEQALEAMRCAVPTGKITLYEWDRAISDLSAALAQPDPQDAELSAALGWPGGISEPVLDRKTLLQQVAALRAALAQQAELSEGLGPLPPTTYVLARESDGYSPERLLSEAAYTEEHMRAYAAAAVALERDSRQAEPVEPVAWLWQQNETGRTRVVTPDQGITADDGWRMVGPLYLAPPQQAEPNAEYERGFIDGMQKQAQSSVDRAVNRMAEPERHFCERCGKRLSQDGVHTCTPPQQIEQAMLGVWQDVPGAVNFGITGDNNG